MCEKGRCVQIWPLVTAGWPAQHTGLLTSSHIVHSAVVVVVEIFSELITSTIFLTQTDQLFSPDTYQVHLLFLISQRAVLLQAQTTTGEIMQTKLRSFLCFS